MMNDRTGRPLEPGEPAPAFALPAINRAGEISLADYRGRSPVFVSLVRGLHCPMCRRYLATLDAAYDRFKAAGVEVLGVLNTEAERARVYYRHRPSAMPLAADPERTTHGAFGLPEIEITSGTTDWPRKANLSDIGAVRIKPLAELPRAMAPFEVVDFLNAKDAFQPTPVDDRIKAAHGTQMTGIFLVDRDGIVRWRHVEAEKGPAELGRQPSVDELLAAARALPG